MFLFYFKLCVLRLSKILTLPKPRGWGKRTSLIFMLFLFGFNMNVYNATIAMPYIVKIYIFKKRKAKKLTFLI